VGEGKGKRKKEKGTKKEKIGRVEGDQEELLHHQQRVSRFSIGQHYGFQFLQFGIKSLFYGSSLASSLIICNSPPYALNTKEWD